MAGRKRVKLPARKAEPALVRGAVVAVLGVLAALGFAWADVDKGTLEVIVGVLVVGLPLLQAAWTRYGVTANAKVLARVSTTTGAVVAGEAATVSTGHQLPTAPGTRAGVPHVAVALDPAYVHGPDEHAP